MIIKDHERHYGETRTLEDGTVQIYMDNEWITISPHPEPSPLPFPGIPVPQVDYPPAQTITISDDTAPPLQEPFPLEVSGVLENPPMFHLNWPDEPGCHVIPPGKGPVCLPAQPGEGTLVIRNGNCPQVYLNGEWQDVMLLPKEVFLFLLKRLEKLEKIVDVSSRFRKIAEEEVEVERPPKKK